MCLGPNYCHWGSSALYIHCRLPLLGFEARLRCCALGLFLLHYKQRQKGWNLSNLLDSGCHNYHSKPTVTTCRSIMLFFVISACLGKATNNTYSYTKYLTLLIAFRLESIKVTHKNSEHEDDRQNTTKDSECSHKPANKF